jgi:hypothetical protein
MTVIRLILLLVLVLDNISYGLMTDVLTKRILSLGLFIIVLDN